MAKIRVRGDTSGYVDIAAPDVAGAATVNLDKIPQTDQNVTFSKDTPELTLQSTNTQAHFRLESTLNNSVWMISNESNANRMRIMHTDTGTSSSIFPMYVHEAGYVTMPLQPYAQASSSAVSTGKIPLDSFNAYRGGLSIDNGNQRFNIPVAGAYVIGYHHLGNSGSGACQVEIRVNGTAVSGSRTQDTNSSNDSFGTQIIRVLAANDYIEFWVISGATHGNNLYNSMWAYLIG
jgi:hypothetical protein